MQGERESVSKSKYEVADKSKSVSKAGFRELQPASEKDSNPYCLRGVVNGQLPLLVGSSPR